MRYALLIALLLLSGCTSGSVGAADAQGAVRSALDVLAAGIDSEDAILASEPVGDNFFLGANVGARFSVKAWGDLSPDLPAVGRFRTYFSDAFNHFANADAQFTVSDVQVNGDIATATVQSRFDAVRTDSTPAENVTFSTTDYMLFELQRGAWRLVRWDEQPVQGPEG